LEVKSPVPLLAKGKTVVGAMEEKPSWANMVARSSSKV
jgi:hypothetical protein